MTLADSQFLGIDEQRLAHCVQVGRQCQVLSDEIFHWDVVKCRQMFLMGFLHDCGYEFAASQPDHAEIGGELLRTVGYLHWREVLHHGRVGTDYQSNELLVLNLADLTTNSAGAVVSIGERLNDIAARYGVDSFQHRSCEELSRFVLVQVNDLSFPEHLRWLLET